MTTPGHYPDGEGDQEVGQEDVEPDLQSWTGRRGGHHNQVLTTNSKSDRPDGQL